MWCILIPETRFIGSIDMENMCKTLIVNVDNYLKYSRNEKKIIYFCEKEKKKMRHYLKITLDGKQRGYKTRLEKVFETGTAYTI